MTKQAKLHSVELESFGAFTNKLIGPLNSSFTFVYGENGAGKTTFSQAIQDTLFGWQKSSALNNSYKPKRSERSVRLVFEREGQKIVLERHKNSEGLQASCDILEGLSKETFQTLLMLTSDELRQLKNTQQLESYLLTAGADTGISPVEALETLEAEFKELTSKSSQYPSSIPNLSAKRKELEGLRLQYVEESLSLREHSYELEDIARPLEDSREKLASIQDQKEQLQAQVRSCKDLLENALRMQREYEDVQEELVQVQEKHGVLLELQAEEACIAHEIQAGMKDALEEWKLELAKQTARFESAQNVVKDVEARKTYEEKVLQESLSQESAYEESQDKRSAAKVSLFKKLALYNAAALCVGFFVSAVLALMPSFELANAFASTVTTALFGSSLVFFSLYLVLKAKGAQDPEANASNTRTSELDSLKREYGIALERLVQEQKILEAHKQSLGKLLGELGFSEQVISCEQALLVIEQERKRAVQEKSYKQEKALLVQSLRRIEDTLQPLREKLKSLLPALGDTLSKLAPEYAEESHALRVWVLDNLASAKDLEHALQSVTSQEKRALDIVSKREAQAQETMQMLYGRKHELRGMLAQSKADDLLSRTKLELAQIDTRLQENQERLLVLYLAQELLQETIDEWKEESQPRVYRRASEFMGFLTYGTFTEVRLVNGKSIRVYDYAEREFEPKILSLGTLQQLYLSLRLALLDCAQDLAPSIPLIADDILVFFDAKRARRALELLCKLATRRQIIFLTCHEFTRDLAQKYIQDLRVIEL